MSSGIRLVSKGDWSKTFKFLERVKNEEYLKVLDELGNQGVSALAAATPKDSGETANSWSYEIEKGRGFTRIVWSNSALGNGWFPIAIMLQYGHGTGRGGYVQGRDYINPAIRPVFDNIAEAAWKAIESS